LGSNCPPVPGTRQTSGIISSLILRPAAGTRASDTPTDSHLESYEMATPGAKSNPLLTIFTIHAPISNVIIGPWIIWGQALANTMGRGNLAKLPNSDGGCITRMRP